MSTTKNSAPVKTDLADSADDREHMKPEEVTLDLPDVKDIPGQEHVRPILSGELGDVTAASDGEEGTSVFGEDDTVETMGNSTVTKTERDLLSQSADSTGSEDDQALIKARVDNTDDDGTPLNESVDQSGNDLDVPGSEQDDVDEEAGEEDEENNSFSLNDDKEDDINTRQ